MSKHLANGMILVFSLFLGACTSGTPTMDPATIKTQSAQTVAVILSATAESIPASVTFTPTIPGIAPITDTPRPTNTPLITDTPPITNTPFINPTLPRTPQAACDQYLFISDITIPDGTTIQPGASFTKTWRIKNYGSCKWNTSYQLVFGYGGEGTDWDKTPPVNFAKDVDPGGMLDVSITLTAPTASGTYGAYFRPRNDKHATFGEFIWVTIKVP